MKKDSFDYSSARNITIEVDGKTISAKYNLQRGNILTVDSMYGRKSAHLGGLTEEGLAKMLLRELYSARDAS